MPITAEQLKRYPNPVFFETGMGMSHRGITAALTAGVFSVVHSVEARHARYNAAVAKFKDDARVVPHLGGSNEVLERVLPTLEGPITFWLDAHPSVKVLTFDNCPILFEIEAIRRLCKKPPTILVDDMHMFSPEDQAVIEANALKAFPEGTAEVLRDDAVYPGDEGTIKGDVLVVRPRSTP